MSPVAYGYVGSMRTRPGCRDDVVAILTEGGDEMRELDGAGISTPRRSRAPKPLPSSRPVPLTSRGRPAASASRSAGPPSAH
ncbi:MAG: hypothetical protein JWP95_164 [Actinotalea sp.]|nr:hypothetical protein [Actinotalea sp.]